MVYVEAAVRRRQLVASARTVMMRDGVARSSLRAIAEEAGIPLGTLQYVFPSKELLLRAVIEDVVEELAALLKEDVELAGGLEGAIRHGVSTFWSGLVAEERNLQLMQYELTTYALRTAGQEDLARWQYEQYCGVVAAWLQEAADNAGETSAVPYTRLARVMVAGIDGLILQRICDPDASRSREDLDAMLVGLVGLAGVREGRGRPRN
jgi:AcrR family transcriptional regulator